MSRRSRVIVLKRHRIVFVPIPRSGCTSIKWQLAGLAGLSRDHFQRTRSKEVSPTLAIHDMDLWEPEHRWSDYTDAERADIRTDDDWLRFSVVRDPAARLWSAWQSKLLLREPQFVDEFGEQSWFPGAVNTAEDVLASFRAFVHALDAPAVEAPRNAHWDPQHTLLTDVRLNFVGRAEDPQATLERILAHVGTEAAIPRVALWENSNPIAYSPCVYDEATAEIVNRIYSGDVSAFEYPELSIPRPSGREEEKVWLEQAERYIPTVRQLIERHLRIGELLEMMHEDERSAARRERQLARSVERQKRARRQPGRAAPDSA